MKQKKEVVFANRHPIKGGSYEKTLNTIFSSITYFLFMLSCASNWPKNFGSYSQEEEIKTIFEAHEYVSEYNYFYTTYQGSPEAIVGIDKDFDLVKVSGWGHTTDWQEIEPGSKKLKEIVEAMYQLSRLYNLQLALIL